jgi:glycosyltransferase involved in cell wall biosynthesis
MVAAGLAKHGDEVHVWGPRIADPRPQTPGVVLHDDGGSFTPADLRRLDAAIDRVPGPRRLFVQWVPHGFGYLSMNVPFCLWVLRRARQRGDTVDIMVHEAFLPFRVDKLKQSVAALVHRMMTVILLRAATRVWYTIPRWEKLWRPYALGRKVPFAWLPLFSNIADDFDATGVAAVRSRFAPHGELIIGHFGTFGTDLRRLLLRILSALPDDLPPYRIVLIGPKGDDAAAELLRSKPSLGGRVHATGPVPAADASRYIHACDVMLQPYTDGVSSRRGSFMASIALGRPTVTTVGFASEPFWKDSGAACFAAPDDVRALASAVSDLLTDTSMRQRVATRARELYATRFEIRHTIETLRAS